MKALLKKRETPFVYNKYYLQIQNKWVMKMNALTLGLSRKKLIWLLALFIGLSAGFFLSNIYAAFSKNNSTNNINTVISKINTNNSKK
jgi:cell division protein FtsL